MLVNRETATTETLNCPRKSRHEKKAPPVREYKAGGAFIMPGKKGMKHYPKELKLEAIRMFFEEGMTRAAIREALGLRSVGRVKVWVQRYRREGIATFDKPIGRPRKDEESEKAELERLRMENALLKKYHTELRKNMLAKRNIGSSINTEKNTK